MTNKVENLKIAFVLLNKTFTLDPDLIFSLLKYVKSFLMGTGIETE